ncbi:MAG TPA: hypothetical protein DCY05_09800 [Spirochaetaceae bacterium]|nr:hypothetical protein [Spirochaetaceae bacterium]HCQ86820.1 hypothetical protein [Spirochaetaceae bacterium]
METTMNKDHQGPIVSTYKPRPPGAARDRGRLLLVLALAVALVAAALFLLRDKTENRLEDYQTVAVSTQTINEIIQVTGSIEMPLRRTVLCPEEGSLTLRIGSTGDWLATGTLLARVEAEELQDLLYSRRRSLSDTGRELAKLELDRRFEEERNHVDLARKLRAISIAGEALTRAQELESAGAGTAKDRQDREQALLEAQEALDLVNLTIEESLVRFQFSRQSLQGEQSDLADEVLDLEARVAGLNVRSPIDGRLLSWQAEEGDQLARYGALAIIADTTQPRAYFAVPESSATRLAIGQSVSILVNDAAWPGRIASIGRETTASDTYGTTIDIEVEFSGEHPEFAAGASASGDILLGSRAGALVLPRGPYLTSGSNRWVYAIEGDYAVKRAVSYGSSEGSMIEVQSGLQVGDLVVISDYSAFIDEERVKLGGKQ